MCAGPITTDVREIHVLRDEKPLCALNSPPNRWVVASLKGLRRNCIDVVAEGRE